MKIQKLLLSSVLITCFTFNASSMKLSFDPRDFDEDEYSSQQITNKINEVAKSADVLSISAKRNTILAGGVFFATLAYNGFNAVSYFLNRSGLNTWLPKPNMYNAIAGVVGTLVSGYFFKLFANVKSQSCVEENGSNNIITELNEQLEEVQDTVITLEGQNNDLNLENVEKNKQDNALIISYNNQEKIVKSDPKDNQLEDESDDYNDISDVENDFLNNQVKPKVDMPKNNQYKIDDDYSDASDCYSDEKKSEGIAMFEENNKILPEQIHGNNIFDQTNVSGYNEVENFFSRIYEKENEQAGNTTSFYEYFLKDDLYKRCEENNKIYFLDKNGYGFIFGKSHEYIGLKNGDKALLNIIFD